MRPWGWLLLTQLSICCALGVSAVLYVHYLNPADSDFCGPRSGCEAVRQSGLGYYFGSRFVSLPLFALVAFSMLLALSLRRARPSDTTRSSIDISNPTRAATGLTALWREPEITLFAASGLGAVIALALLVYQAVGLESYCWLCVIVDVAALACALFAFFVARASRSGAGTARTQALESPFRSWAWLGVAGLLVLAPLVWSAIKPLPAIPRAIAALYQPGKINVVEFADFECPYCRRLHASISPLVKEYATEVHLVRAHRPLPQHENAERAARAAVCAEAQGVGEAMADALFEITLSPEAITKSAESLRLDPGAFDACMLSEATSAILARDAALLPDTELRGLPTTYVGNKLFVGVPTETALRDAFERAKRPRAVGLSGAMYVTGLGLLIALVAFFGRRRNEPAMLPK